MNLYALYIVSCNDSLTVFCCNSTLATLPLMVVSPVASKAAVTMQKLTAMTDINSIMWPSLLIAITAVAYYLEYLMSFTFVGFVRPMTYSVSDIVRRVSIISVGAAVFQKPLSLMNGVGIAVALCGVLAYSLLEYQQGLKSKITQSIEKGNALTVRSEVA